MPSLVERARGGSVRAVSRLISRLEDDPRFLATLFRGMARWPTARLVVGVTGPPGVGKSSLVDGLITVWRTQKPDQRLGVLAVDPSSPYTGGAVLGDRVRMMNHATDGKVFIRSLASRGHLGGLTLGIRGSLRVMGLAGCDVVLVETVGVGQNELEVAEVADFVCVVLAPGQGDGVQLLKAGLLEAGDVFVVNKADRPGAEALCAALRETLRRFAPGHDDPEVFEVSTVQHRGLTELAAALERRAAALAETLSARRSAALRQDAGNAIRETALRRVAEELDRAAFADAVECVLDGRTSVDDLAEALLRKMVFRPAMAYHHGDQPVPEGPESIGEEEKRR